MNAPIVSHLQSPDAWKDRERLVHFCADQLRMGRLALVLGAGASDGFGLPSWPKLIDRLAAGKLTIPADTTIEVRAELVLDKVYKRDEAAFSLAVKAALYQDFDPDLSKLHARGLLAAIGALAMPLRRGSVRTIVTFNFDDTIETYLEHFGFQAEREAILPAWSGDSDVRVLHPHGLLPHVGEPEGHLVFTAASYNQVVGDQTKAWNSRLAHVFASHTCLFIGLSGSDTNLQSLLMKAKALHAASHYGHPYWGVSFIDESNAHGPIWEGRGVAPFVVQNWDQVPQLLFEIRQEASGVKNRGGSAQAQLA